MHSTVKRQIEMLEGVPPFAHKPEITLNAEATALVTSIETVLASLNTLAGNQVSGGANYHAGTEAKELYVGQMLVYMRAMSKVARELPQETNPGIREKFRLPRQTSYLAFVATARSFVTEAGPIKAVFVANGLPADFDEKLTELAEQLEEALVDQTTGRVTQVGSTAGLAAKAREGVKLVRRLDGIFSFQLRNDPVLHAEWLSVSHVEMPPRRKKDEEAETPAAPSAAPAPLVAFAAAAAGPAEPALNGHHAASQSDGEQQPAVVEPRVNGTHGTALV
jgi:hypothetical protein